MANNFQHGVDMNTNLMTPDGFPRADLDVAQSEHKFHHHFWTILISLFSPNNTITDNIPEE